MKKSKIVTHSKTRLSKHWLWIIAGVVLIFVLVLLARTLSQTPRSQPEQKPIELVKEDLDTYTRMLGKVFIDTLPLASLPKDLQRSLRQADTMIANRELRDCIARLTKLQRKRTPLEQAALYLYIGYSYFELGQSTNALSAFQNGIRLINPPPENVRQEALFGLLTILGFNTGYLFQFYSMPESALVYYQLSRQALDYLTEPPSELPPAAAQSAELAGWLLNNLGVAAEKTHDTVLARAAYLAALNYIDTTARTTTRAAQSAERLRKNISRLANKSK